MKNIFLIILILLTKSYSIACSCVGNSDIKTDFKSADIVISGTVVDSNVIKIWSDTSWLKSSYLELKKAGKTDSMTYDFWKNNNRIAYTEMIDYKIIIKNKYKIKNHSDTITIRTGFGHGDCGYNFVIGKSYLIFGKNESKINYSNNGVKRDFTQLKNTYRTNICMRTKLLSLAQKDLLYLKKK